MAMLVTSMHNLRNEHATAAYADLPKILCMDAHSYPGR